MVCGDVPNIVLRCLAICSVIVVVISLDYNDLKFEYEITENSVSWLSSFSNKLYGRPDYYQPKSILATRMQIWKDSAFLVTPRFLRENPFTVSRMHLRGKRPISVLLPYPSWSMHEVANQDGIRNAVDIFVDQKDIMWILDDGGVANDTALYNQTIARHPKILSYDIKHGKILNRILLSNLTCSNSKLKNIFVEYTENGNCFLYLSDCAANGAVIVWDVFYKKGYRSLLPSAVKGSFINTDVLYMVLVLGKTSEESTFYFTYLNGNRFFSMKTSHLRKKVEHGAIENRGAKCRNYVLLGSDKQSVYLRRTGDRKVYRWNIKDMFQQDLLHKIYESYEPYICNQIVADSKGQLWALENNFQNLVKEDNKNCTTIAKLIRL